MRILVRHHIYGFILLNFLSASCNYNRHPPSDEPVIVSQSDAQTNWVRGHNDSKTSLAKHYDQDVVSIYQNDIPIVGKDEVIKKSFQNHIKIDSSYSIAKIVASRDSIFEYDIIWHANVKGEKFKSIVIWKNNNNSKKRQLEYIAPISDFTADTTSINTQRQKWITLCNQHDARNLIEKMYTSEAIYYNHQAIVRGHQAINEVYSYMNDSTYKLDLIPIIVESVNEKTYFEIGQCNGSYGGKYIIVWEKQENGEWLVSLDSNI